MQTQSKMERECVFQSAGCRKLENKIAETRQTEAVMEADPGPSPGLAVISLAPGKSFFLLSLKFL